MSEIPTGVPISDKKEQESLARARETFEEMLTNLHSKNSLETSPAEQKGSRPDIQLLDDTDQVFAELVDDEQNTASKKDDTGQLLVQILNEPNTTGEGGSSSNPKPEIATPDSNMS